MEVNDPVFEIVKDDVSAILRYSRPHTRLQQFLDLRHDFVFVFVGSCRSGRRIRKQDRPAGGKMLHDHRKYCRLKLVPVAVSGLCNSDEIGAEEDAGDLGQRE